MLLQELIEYIFALCSSKDRSILCQVSREWHTLAIKVSSQLSLMGDIYYNQALFDDDTLYGSGDYHLIVRLKRKYNRFRTLCQFGYIDIIKLLISLGATDWNLGLAGACGGGHLELAELMITNGANEWNYGLLAACKGGHLETANLMIASGADNWTFGLSYACSNGHLELVKLMISCGATWRLGCGALSDAHK